jgi:hypothetical protein
MGLFNTGMGLDWMGICVHASNYPPRKLYGLLTFLKIICDIIVNSLSSTKRNYMSVSCRFKNKLQYEKDAKCAKCIYSWPISMDANNKLVYSYHMLGKGLMLN